MMLDKLNVTCSKYGMAINTKKSKVMVASKGGQIKCIVILDKKILEPVPCYKYMGNWITEDSRSEEEIKTRIALAKEALWKNKKMLSKNVRPRTKMKLLKYCVFSILNY